jgi:hypothetical protein
VLVADKDREEWASVECKNRKRQHDKGLLGIGVIWLLRLWGLDAFGGRGNRSPPGLVRLGLWGVLESVLSDLSTIVLLYVKIMTSSSSSTLSAVFILVRLFVYYGNIRVAYYSILWA